MKQHATVTAQFCCICLCVMFDQGFNLNWLRSWTADKGSIDILNSICKECRYDVSLETDRSIIIEAFHTISGTYCKETDDIIFLRHDKIYDIAAKICGEHLLYTFISHASPKFISQRYALHDSRQLADNEYLIKIIPQHEDTFLKRILKDVSNGNMDSFAFNDQLN